MDVKAAPNGVATIEDRILRITGYYGYYPGYSSQKSTSRSSVTRCKPGANYPSSHSGISRQLSPLSVTEDSSAPIFELQSRGSSGVCGHRVERQNRSGEDGTQTLPENSSQENRSKARCRSCTSMVLKAVWGLLIILSVSSSWVGTTQIVKITYKNFYCPFFMTWFSTNWNIMFFPVYYSGHLATAQEKQSPMKKFRECSRIFGEDGLTLKLFLKRTAPFSILWTLTNYLYLLALKKLTATDVSALFCCNKAFVFLLSWIVLKDRFMGVRIVAAIMAITGIVMMAYADNFHTDSIIGVAFAVGSASTSALYKVLFKMFLGSANFGEAAHFVSTLGFFNLIFISFTPIILYFTKVEHWSSFAALPWGYLCGMAGLWLAFNILVNVGVVLTYPILISIGTVLSVPGNAAVDLLKQEVIFNVVRLAATIIICIGFLLMLLPEEWDEITLRFINSLKEKKSEDHVEDITDSSVHLRTRSRANGTVSIPLA
ncbi:solute carrier family 35 member F4 [Halichoerus grypus]|uniref:Solute carrier family 35 member F4 n=1 Tax=Neomonachus schauinslandi TaxID=29088 RepID=A0A2Y9I6G1_NEOSC|nr:solute carrier family 35 member F4 [Neomonachus schauinslandi]XP_032261078.1 solute carrier family 35 member F4 [Phoca vitulina]